MNLERAYAAKQLLNFLQHVGPIEAVWAMTTALEQLQDLSPGEDHVAGAGLALKESLDEFDELAAAVKVPPAGDQGGEGGPVKSDGTDTPPPADPDAGDQGGEALLAETPPAEPPAPAAPKKSRRAG